jgi:hypothetical protein
MRNEKVKNTINQLYNTPVTGDWQPAPWNLKPGTWNSKPGKPELRKRVLYLRHG